MSSFTTSTLYVWQSRVEIEHYSIAYFDHVTAFPRLKRCSAELSLRAGLIRAAKVQAHLCDNAPNKLITIARNHSTSTSGNHSKQKFTSAVEDSSCSSYSQVQARNPAPHGLVKLS